MLASRIVTSTENTVIWMLLIRPFQYRPSDRPRTAAKFSRVGLSGRAAGLSKISFVGLKTLTITRYRGTEKISAAIVPTITRIGPTELSRSRRRRRARRGREAIALTGLPP